MKTFLITLSIIGAIVYGMLQINEHYDNKGACSWSLLSGGYYYHEERLDNAVDGIISYSIEQDKKARRTFMQQQGKSEVEINKTLKNLEPQYKIEKEKMQKYCYLDFDKEPYFQKKSIVVKPSDYCEVGNSNNYKDKGYGYFDIEYNFDKESLKFFNNMRYIYKTKKNKWQLFLFDGIKYEEPSFPCEVRFKGIGEGSTVLITDKEIFDKTKYVDIKF